MSTDAAPVPDRAESPVSAPGRRDAVAVLALQVQVSVAGLTHLLVLAALLPAQEFDAYAVWYTVLLAVVGMCQCVGAERVLIGARRHEDGPAAALVLGVVAGGLLAVLALALDRPGLALASASTVPLVVWDHQRVAGAGRDAGCLLRADLVVLVLQAAALAVVAAAGGATWLPVAWWLMGGVCWTALLVLRARRRRLLLSLRKGARVLREDLAQVSPLLLDAAMASIVLVAGLVVLQSAAEPGAASALRVAVSLLGPVAMLGLVVRRVVYSRVGLLSERSWLTGFGLVLLGAVAAGILILAPGRAGVLDPVVPAMTLLAWWGVAFLVLDRAVLTALSFPAALLRARDRARTIAGARLVGVLLAIGVLVALRPLSAAVVAAACATASVTYAGLLVAAAARGTMGPGEQRARRVGIEAEVD